MVAVEGRSGTLILDDTYNSSPPSALAALDLLADLPGRRVAILGDMLELGSYEREGHLKVGCRAAEVVEALIVVGDLGDLIAEGAIECGLSGDSIHRAADSKGAVAMADSVVEAGDVVLIKGSRGVKMERIVAALTEDGRAETGTAHG
jgi:UDP-N-acetylmuramoyl-tripeptide--D-alanyl-D-alanine ligase